MSKAVSKDEILMINTGKSASFGKVKSYGPVSTLLNSIGKGAQGSPVFNEIGKCWGLVVSCLNDIPDKNEEEIVHKLDLSSDEEQTEGKRKRHHKKDKKKRDKKRKDKEDSRQSTDKIDLTDKSVKI